MSAESFHFRYLIKGRSPHTHIESPDSPGRRHFFSEEVITILLAGFCSAVPGARPLNPGARGWGCAHGSKIKPGHRAHKTQISQDMQDGPRGPRAEVREHSPKFSKTGSKVKGTP